MYDPLASFEKNTLPNGLDIYSYHVPRPWAIVRFVIHAGAHEDPVVLPGLAHFVEHCVSNNIEGTSKKYVSEYLMSQGGSCMLGSTTYKTTQYSFKIPIDKKVLQQALSFFGNMLITANLKEKVENERSIIIREFNERYSVQEQLEWQMAIRAALFKGNRLETYNRPLGRPSGINSITEADLQSFYDRYYVPANISVIVAGGFEKKDVLDLLIQSPFGTEKKGERNVIPTPFTNFVNPTPEEQNLTIKISDYTTMKIDRASYDAQWAFPISFPRKDRMVFSAVLKEILNEEIREKEGLAYSIGLEYGTYHDIAEYKISGVVSPDAIGRIDDIVRACIYSVTDHEDMFNKKLLNMKVSHFMDDASITNIVNEAASDLSDYQRLITLEEDFLLFEDVRFDRVNEMIALLAKERQHTFINMP